MEPKRTILGTSSWASWQAVWLSKGQQANNLSTVEPACQEAQTDDSGDLFLGLLASRLTVEEATSDKSEDSRTCLPGSPNGRFLGPLLGPPGNQFHCRKKDRPRRTPAGEHVGPRWYLAVRGCPNSRVQSTETSTWDQRTHIQGKSLGRGKRERGKMVD